MKRGLAGMIRVTPKTLYCLIADGKVRHTKPGCRILIAQSAVNEYLASGDGAAYKGRGT